MASAVAADSTDTLTCSVCHNFFHDPKLLPCGHLLCRDCLLSWMESNKNASCPLCRHRIVDADSEGNLNEIADMLPTDLSMVRLVEAEQLLHKQHQCCSCEEVVATSLCLNCRDMICKSCAKMHIKFSSSKNHVVEELSNLTPEKLSANHGPPTCAYHANEVCTLYCPTHEELICHTCAVTRHRQCQEVKELEEKVSEAHAVLAELVKKLKEGQVLMNHSIEQLDQHLQETEKKIQTLMAEIDAVCDKLESAVKECRRHLKELVHRAGAEVKDAVKDGKTYLLQQKGKVTSHSIVAERIQEIKTHNEVRTMTAVMKSRVDDMDLSATLPADFKVVSAVKMEISSDVVSEVEAKLREVAEIQCIPADVKAQPADVKAQPKVTTWNFHGNHGKNVVLSNNDQTADRVTTPSYGIVMSREQMEVNTLYQVEMNEVLSKWNYQYNMLGVAVQAPDTISLPCHVYSGPSFAILIDSRRVLNRGSGTQSSLGAPLRHVRAGSRVGLLLDMKRDVHLYLDGRDLGVFTSAVPEPCFFLMDLRACWKKVTTLPLEPVS
ncbi:E3 ubiquitin-protein ligase TRIM56-like isoform X1 [Babylonia areolata]|uniref:E3 ubiquitin-protein ligase TRIM56-like isoform X1 n=1 Tax=Babylonia areolata TaxID=304850 RepID=UPI003FD0CF6B